MSGQSKKTGPVRIGLSEGDLERIATFAATPRYAREPEMLLPEESEPAVE